MNPKNVDKAHRLMERWREFSNALTSGDASDNYFVGTVPCFGKTIQVSLPEELKAIARHCLMDEMVKIEKELVSLGVTMQVEMHLTQL